MPSNNIPIPSWYKPEPPKSWWKRFLMALMGSLTSFFGVAPVAQAQLPVFLQPLASRVRTLETEEQATSGIAPTASRIQKDIQKQVALAKEEAAAASEITSIEYEIKIGDSLSKIAQDFYGDINHWPVIYVMNQGQIKNPNLIYPGQKLIIPLPAAGAKQFSRENIVEATAAAAALQGVKETVTAGNAEEIALQISTSSENIPSVSRAAVLKTEVVQVKEASEIIADTATAIDSTALSIYKAAQQAVQTPGITEEQTKQASTIAYTTLTLQSFARQESERTPADEKDKLSIVANLVITARMLQAESQKIADLNLSLDPQSPAGAEVKQVSRSLAQKIEEIGNTPLNISPALKAEIDVALAGTAGTGEARESTTAPAPHYGSFTEMKEENPVAYSVFTVVSWAIPAVVGIPMQLGKVVEGIVANPIEAIKDLGFAVSTLFGAFVDFVSPSVPAPTLGEVQAQITEDQREAEIAMTEAMVMAEVQEDVQIEQAQKEMDEEAAKEQAEFEGEFGEEQATTEETAPAAPASLEDSAAREQGFATAELAQAFGSTTQAEIAEQQEMDNAQFSQVYADMAAAAAQKEADADAQVAAMAEAIAQTQQAYAAFETSNLSEADRAALDRAGETNPGFAGTTMTGGGYTTGVGLTGKSSTGVSARDAEGYGISLGEMGDRAAAAGAAAAAGVGLGEAGVALSAAEQADAGRAAGGQPGSAPSETGSGPTSGFGEGGAPPGGDAPGQSGSTDTSGNGTDTSGQ